MTLSPILAKAWVCYDNCSLKTPQFVKLWTRCNPPHLRHLVTRTKSSSTSSHSFDILSFLDYHGPNLTIWEWIGGLTPLVSSKIVTDPRSLPCLYLKSTLSPAPITKLVYPISILVSAFFLSGMLSYSSLSGPICVSSLVTPSVKVGQMIHTCTPKASPLSAFAIFADSCATLGLHFGDLHHWLPLS